MLLFARLCYAEPNAIENATGYPEQLQPIACAVIGVYDAACNVIETHEHAGDFKQTCRLAGIWTTR